jgi:hypothetical protein
MPTHEGSAPRSPASVSEVTPSWLTDALSARFPRWRVRAAHVTNLIRGTATKARFEVEWEGPAREGGPPGSFWIKAGFEDHSASKASLYGNEARFYRDLSRTLGINVPDHYYAALDAAGGGGLLVLEDLLARKARFGSMTSPVSVETAREVLDMQARYHARYWKTGAAELDWLSTGGAIDKDGVVDMFLGFWDASMTLPRFEAVTTPLRDRDRIADAMHRLWEEAAAASPCLVHGDAHLGNLFLEPSGRAGYLDWQTVMRGPWAHDVASFLVPALEIEDRRRAERDLLRYYLDRLSSYGADAPRFEEAWNAYRKHAMWTFMWALCPPALQAERECTPAASRACAAIIDLETLQLLAG